MAGNLERQALESDGAVVFDDQALLGDFPLAFLGQGLAPVASHGGNRMLPELLGAHLQRLAHFQQQAEPRVGRSGLQVRERRPRNAGSIAQTLLAHVACFAQAFEIRGDPNRELIVHGTGGKGGTTLGSSKIGSNRGRELADSGFMALRLASRIAIGAAASFLCAASCTPSGFGRAVDQYQAARYPEALALLRQVEAEQRAWAAGPRLRYALYRGLAELAVGNAPSAHSWLSTAKRMHALDPGLLSFSDRGRLDAAWQSLGKMPGQTR